MRVSSPRFMGISGRPGTILWEAQFTYNQPFKKVVKCAYVLETYLFSKLGLITYKQLLISLEQPKQSLTSGALIQLKIPDLLKTPLTKMQI